jgi:hypothetical protein
MTKLEETSLVKKVLDLNSPVWSLKSVYFNPSFVNNFVDKTQLTNFGFSFELNEVESESGTVVKAALIGPKKERLELGSILLDGKDIIIQEDLRTFEDIETFVANNIQEERVAP